MCFTIPILNSVVVCVACVNVNKWTFEWKTETTSCFFLVVKFMSCECSSPCDMEGLSTAMFVAGHTGSCGCFTLSALVLTDIACLQSMCTYPHKWTTENICKGFVLIRVQMDHTDDGYLVVAIVWHRLEYYRLHSWHISKFHLRYVKGTNNVSPTCKKTKKTVTISTFKPEKKV